MKEKLQTLDVEIVLKDHSNIAKNTLTTVVQNYLEQKKIRLNDKITNFHGEEQLFGSYVKCLLIGNIANYNKLHINFKDININWHLYVLDETGPIWQSDTTEDGDQINIATHLTLPSADLFDLWENLHYNDNIKENLLNYAKTMIEFSDRGVNPQIVSCNRVILLHGPPGTGKTSLCKALAQKLSIKLSERFNSGLLIEINSHSLFSKWFSESGKLVNNMFAKIREVCENTRILVCVLIDEVESLAHARDQCISGNEPSDAIRVVNAMLTEIDHIKKCPNVLILATSNMTEAIDLAFVDRADIKQYLGMPSVTAVYKIYHSCLMELVKAGILQINPSVAEKIDPLAIDEASDNIHEHSKNLISICEKSVGLSGRSLRKIPFIAHALHLEDDYGDIGKFLDAMERAVLKELEDQKSFKTMKNINN